MIEKETYASLCELAKTTVFEHEIDINSFHTPESFDLKPLNERLTSALYVLLQLIKEEEGEIERLDGRLIDKLINRIDDVISEQVDVILQNKMFKKIESLWRGLEFLIKKTDSDANTFIHLLDVDRNELKVDFEECLTLSESALYQAVYMSEYDMPGGEPYAAIISPYQFGSSQEDIQLLSQIAKVAESAHCPFIGNVGAEFFKKQHISDITKINDLSQYMEKSEFIKWNALRKKESSRYIGLVLPQFVVRLSYEEMGEEKGFQFSKMRSRVEESDYVWGAGSFAFAANLCRSFKTHGWCVNIIGAESGGKVEDLSIPSIDLGCGKVSHIPTETLLSESKELALAELGFIPLSYYKNSDYACFFSANSIQSPEEYDDYQTSADARINARLPYIFLSSRLAHYIKVIQREQIGSNKNRLTLEQELNKWLKGLITKMNDPSPDVVASHPLKEGYINVKAVAGKPGYYYMTLSVMPHFQIEGINVRLSLQSELPGSNDVKEES